MRKLRYIIILILALSILLICSVFLCPHPLLDTAQPIESITVTVVDMDLPAKLTPTTYQYSAQDPEFSLICNVLAQYSYHYSFETIESHYSRTASTNGNDAGYWINLYLDTATERHTMISGGTGSIILDNIVYRIGYIGNSEELKMMDKIRQIVTP